MLKVLMLRREIDLKEEELRALEAKDAEFAAREAELTAAIGEVKAEEERGAVEAMVTEFDAARSAHDAAKSELSAAIEALRTELRELEEAQKLPETAQQRGTAQNEKEVRTMPFARNNVNIRSLPHNQRAFDALPMETRQTILAQDDVQAFLAQVRGIIATKRAVQGAELTVPVTFLDLISENVYRYSKLMNRFRVRTVRGESRQTVAGLVPEAVWEGCCDALNELTFQYSQIDVTCNKVGGYVLLCNSIKDESDLDLAGDLIEMISESIGLAKDKAGLYGKGQAYSMPMGIVTRLAQQSKPDSYPVNAPEWVDYHTTNIITIDASLTGAAFWAALTVAAGNTFTRYSRGEQFWAMNSKTYNLLKSKVITFTATGDIAANVFGTLPIINGDIDILEFIPDGDIIGGYGDLYLWAQHQGMELGSDMAGFTLRVKDSTLFWGKERADGTPLIAGAFVAININGQAVTTEMTFAANTANNAALQALTVGSLTLSPTFDADVLTYTASAANNVSSVAVTATPEQADAGISITVTSGTTTKNVNNGGSAALAVGANVLTITVGKGNNTRVYSVTVTRAAS